MKLATGGHFFFLSSFSGRCFFFSLVRKFNNFSSAEANNFQNSTERKHNEKNLLYGSHQWLTLFSQKAWFRVQWNNRDMTLIWRFSTENPLSGAVSRGFHACKDFHLCRSQIQLLHGLLGILVQSNDTLIWKVKMCSCFQLQTFKDVKNISRNKMWSKLSV